VHWWVTFGRVAPPPLTPVLDCPQMAAGAGNGTAVEYAFGVQALPDGCLVMNGDPITPFSISLAGAATVTLVTALSSVAFAMCDGYDRHWHHALRFPLASPVTLALHALQLAAFLYQSSTVGRLGAAWARFTPWQRYCLWVQRVWSSGLFPWVVSFSQRNMLGNVNASAWRSVAIDAARWRDAFQVRDGSIAAPPLSLAPMAGGRWWWWWGGGGLGVGTHWCQLR
jgi:hypothetical protein